MHAGAPPTPELELLALVLPAPPSPPLEELDEEDAVGDGLIVTPSPPLHAESQTPRRRNVDVRMTLAYADWLRFEHRFCRGVQEEAENAGDNPDWRCTAIALFSWFTSFERCKQDGRSRLVLRPCRGRRRLNQSVQSKRMQHFPMKWMQFAVLKQLIVSCLGLRFTRDVDLCIANGKIHVPKSEKHVALGAIDDLRGRGDGMAWSCIRNSYNRSTFLVFWRCTMLISNVTTGAQRLIGITAEIAPYLPSSRDPCQI